jgi:hypothetical protein
VPSIGLLGGECTGKTTLALQEGGRCSGTRV